MTGNQNHENFVGIKVVQKHLGGGGEGGIFIQENEISSLQMHTEVFSPIFLLCPRWRVASTDVRSSDGKIRGCTKARSGKEVARSIKAHLNLKAVKTLIVIWNKWDT